MTRLPKTPLQDQADDNREQLIRYLLRQSEARQVMFLRSLSSDRLRYELVGFARVMIVCAKLRRR